MKFIIIINLYILSTWSYGQVVSKLKIYRPDQITTAVVVKGDLKFDFYRKASLPGGASEHIMVPIELHKFFLTILERASFVEFSGYPKNFSKKLEDSYVDYIGEILLINKKEKEKFRIQLLSLDSVVIRYEKNDSSSKVIEEKKYIWAGSERELSEFFRFWTFLETVKTAKKLELGKKKDTKLVKNYLINEYNNTYKKSQLSILAQESFFKSGWISYLGDQIIKQK